MRVSRWKMKRGRVIRAIRWQSVRHRFAIISGDRTWLLNEASVAVSSSLKSFFDFWSLKPASCSIVLYVAHSVRRPASLASSLSLMVTSNFSSSRYLMRVAIDVIRRNQTRSDVLCLERLEAVLSRLLRMDFGLVQLDHVREHVEVLGLLSQLGAAALHVIEQLLQLGSRL